MPDTEHLLEIRDFQPFNGESHVLQGMSFAVGKAETAALPGRNGAAKTPARKSVMGRTWRRWRHILAFDEDFRVIPYHNGHGNVR